MEYGYLKNITFKTKVLNVFRRLFFLKPLENFLVKKNIEKGGTGFLTKLIPNHYQYPKGTYRFKKVDNVNYRLDLSELNEWWLYYGFKEEYRSALIDLINKGDWIIDIGANLGEVSFLASQKVGSSGKVYSFEPDPDNYTRFDYNLSLNTFTNIVFVKKGLGDNPGKYKIAMNVNEPGNNGSNSIVPDKKTDINKLAREIDVVRFDDWIAENPLDKIDLVKIDIEGFELQALKGAEMTLKKYKPIIYSELHDVKLREHGTSAKELIDYLKALGYTVHSDDKDQSLSGNLKGIHTDIVCRF